LSYFHVQEIKGENHNDSVQRHKVVLLVLFSVPSVLADRTATTVIMSSVCPSDVVCLSATLCIGALMVRVQG